MVPRPPPIPRLRFSKVSDAFIWKPTLLRRIFLEEAVHIPVPWELAAFGRLLWLTLQAALYYQ